MGKIKIVNVLNDTANAGIAGIALYAIHTVSSTDSNLLDTRAMGIWCAASAAIGAAMSLAGQMLAKEEELVAPSPDQINAFMEGIHGGKK